MENGLTYVKGGIAVVGAALSTILGGWDLSLKVLVMFVVLDYFTGIAAAYYKKELSSKVGANGITRKIFLFIPVVMAFYLDQLSGREIFRNLAIWFYTANEGLSVLENLGRIGVLVPPGLLNALQQLKSKGEGDA